MSVDESNINDVVAEIAEKLETCVVALLECEEENKVCKKCKNKNDCLIFIRSVLASLCRIAIAQMVVEDKKIPEGLYV